MKKFLKISLIIMLFLVVLVAGIGFIGWNYLSSQFFLFEDEYQEQLEFQNQGYETAYGG